MLAKTNLHQLVRFWQPWDVYTHHFVSPQRRTVEHLIPTSRLRSLGKIRQDVGNLWMADLKVNQWRRNYRFAAREDILATPGWEQHMGCLRHTTRQLYYPAHGHRLIAHSISSLMLRHPILEDQLDVIFHSPSCLEDWLATPWTDREHWMRIRNDQLREVVVADARND